MVTKHYHILPAFFEFGIAGLLQSRLTSPGLYGMNLTRITQMGRIPRKLKRIRVFRSCCDIRVESFLTLQ